MNTYVMSRCSSGQALQVASKIQEQAEFLESPIKVSLDFTSGSTHSGGWATLSLTGFRSKEVFLSGVPPSLEWVLESAGEEDRAPLEDPLTRSDLWLAQLCSEVVGEAWCFMESDTLCCSAAINFRDGRITSGAGYGFDGSDLHVEFADRTLKINRRELDGTFDYNEPLEQGLKELFESPAANAGGEDSEIRFVLISKRQLVQPIKQERGATARFYTWEDVGRWRKVKLGHLEGATTKYLQGDMEQGGVWLDFKNAHEDLAAVALAEKRWPEARTHLSLAAEAVYRQFLDLQSGMEIAEWMAEPRELTGAAWLSLIGGNEELYWEIRSLQDELFPGEDKCALGMDALVEGDADAAGAALEGIPAEQRDPFFEAIIDGEEATFGELLNGRVREWRQRITSEGLRGFPDSVGEWWATVFVILAERTWKKTVSVPSPVLLDELVRSPPAAVDRREYRPWGLPDLYIPGPHYKESLRIDTADGARAYPVGQYVRLRVFQSSSGWIRVPVSEAERAPVRRVNPPPTEETEVQHRSRNHFPLRWVMLPTTHARQDWSPEAMGEVYLKKPGRITVQAIGEPYSRPIESNILEIEAVDPNEPAPRKRLFPLRWRW